MKSKILLPVVFLSFSIISINCLAYEYPADDFPYYPTQPSAETSQASDDQLSEFYANMQTMESADKINFIKSPCANLRGYNFRRFRGFGFENGVIKKFGFVAPLLTIDPMKFTSMADFFRRRKVCQPATKNVRPLGFSIYMLDIWR